MTAIRKGRRLPALGSLRAFEAAARHLSFTRAAEELRVTHSAVSHQIRALEADLGFPLFRRVHRAVVLTPAGERYHATVGAAFDLLDQGTTDVTAEGPSGLVMVSCFVSFAQRWLVPRMGRLTTAYPDVEVHITASQRLVPMPRDDVDVGIAYHSEEVLGANPEHLFMRERLILVCAPALARELEAGGPSMIRAYRLLHDRNWPRNWTTWATAVGMPAGGFDRGPTFSHAILLIEAAIAGVGLAIAPASLVLDELRTGRLSAPVRFQVDAGFAYYLQFPRQAVQPGKTKAFCAWLRAEAGTFTTELDRALEGFVHRSMATAATAGGDA